MDELRKKQKVQIKLKTGEIIEGTTLDYSDDRVLILLSKEIDNEKINELDDIFVKVQTHLGLISMNSTIINPPDKNNCIVIENNKSIKVPQKREFARVNTSFSFIAHYLKKDTIVMCDAVNISAGGIAFLSDVQKFDLGDDVLICFSSDDFEKDMRVYAKIIKQEDRLSIAQFINLKQSDEDRIVKYVFKLMVKK